MQKTFKCMKGRRKGDLEKERVTLGSGPLLPKANPILSCLLYYPATEQDRLVQYWACTDPFSFLGP